MTTLLDQQAPGLVDITIGQEAEFLIEIWSPLSDEHGRAAFLLRAMAGEIKRLEAAGVDALRANYEEMRECQGDWARALHTISATLPPEAGYSPPGHDPDCASCTIGQAIRVLARHHLGQEHPLAAPLPPPP